MSRNPIIRSMVSFTAALAFGLAACQTTTEQDTEQTDTQGTGSEFDQGSGTSTSTRSTSITSLETVYFDYDRSEIRPDARSALQTNATAIKGNNDWGVVTVEGHCDERGSDEYNLALGNRRANAVKRYLVDLGVPTSRLRTVSFGEDKPAVQGHNESAWRYNRRSDFSAGG